MLASFKTAHLLKRRRAIFIFILSFSLFLLSLPIVILITQSKESTLRNATASGSTYDYAISLLQKSGDDIIAADPLNHLDSQRPYDDPSWDCSALYEGANALQSIDPTRTTNFRNYATSIANFLVAHKDDNNNSLVGWGLAYAWDAFQDGTINPANTEYAYQTALAARCLLDAYTTTGNTTYLQTVEDAVTAFQHASTATTFTDPLCNGCFYFGYSLNSNDNGRLVKNTNMLMAMVVAKLSKITGNSSYTTLANTLFSTEQYEINMRNNYNYLGYNDPDYSSNGGQEDSHLAMELWGLEDLGTDVSGLAYQTPLQTLKTVFWNCGSACQATTSTDYGMFASCYLANEDAYSKNTCATAISLYSSPTVQSHVDGVSMIGVVHALPAFFTPTTVPGCITSNTAWRNQAITSQTSTFEAQFDVTPNTNGMAGVVGLSQNAPAAYTDFASIVALESSGIIDARNGPAYQAQNSVPYTAGNTYHFRLEINIPSHTYSIYVTPPGSSEITLGTNYAFRTEQSSATSINYLGTISSTGNLNVCNFVSGSAPIPTAAPTAPPERQWLGACSLAGAAASTRASVTSGSGSLRSNAVVSFRVCS